MLEIWPQFVAFERLWFRNWAI